jgi:hypothetical protein
MSGLWPSRQTFQGDHVLMAPTAVCQERRYVQSYLGVTKLKAVMAQERQISTQRPTDCDLMSSQSRLVSIWSGYRPQAQSVGCANV